jgi:hypothetical protein
LSHLVVLAGSTHCAWRQPKVSLLYEIASETSDCNLRFGDLPFVPARRHV